MSEYQLYQGDCLEIMKQIPDRSVNFILTDPPYGTTVCKWDNVIPFEPMWEQLNRIVKPNGVIALFGTEPFSSKLRLSNIKNYKYDWVWEKSKATGFLNAKKQPLRAYENISIFYYSQPNYQPQITQGVAYNKGVRKLQTLDDVYGKFNQVEVKSEGKRYPRNVIYFKTAESEGKVYHKTQKPVALLEYLIKTYTIEGETVLDFTMGSGSTGEACLRTNRNFIGIEKEGNYFNIAKDRLEKVEGELSES